MSKITSIVHKTTYQSSNDDDQHLEFQQNFGSMGFDQDINTREHQLLQNYQSSKQTTQFQSSQHYETSNVVTKTVVSSSQRTQSCEGGRFKMQVTSQQANQSEEFNLQGGQHLSEEEGAGERISAKYNYRGYNLEKKHASHKSSDLTLNKYSFANASLKNKQFVSQTGKVRIACESAMRAAQKKQEEVAQTHIGGWEMELRAGLQLGAEWQQKITIQTKQGGAAYYRLMAQQAGKSAQINCEMLQERQVMGQVQEPELIELACAPQDAEVIEKKKVQYMEEPEQIELACCPQDAEVMEKRIEKPQQFKSENMIQVSTTCPGSYRQFNSLRSIIQPQFLRYQGTQSNSVRVVQAPIQEEVINQRIAPTILQGISFGSPISLRHQIVKSEPLIQVRPVSQQVIQVHQDAVPLQQVVTLQQQTNVIHHQQQQQYYSHQITQQQPYFVSQTVQQPAIYSSKSQNLIQYTEKPQIQYSDNVVVQQQPIMYQEQQQQHYNIIQTQPQQYIQQHSNEMIQHQIQPIQGTQLQYYHQKQQYQHPQYQNQQIVNYQLEMPKTKSIYQVAPKVQYINQPYQINQYQNQQQY